MTSTDEKILDAPNEEQTDQEEKKQKMSLEVQVDRSGDCERHVTVTISREDIDRYLDDAFSEMMPTAAVPGFRPGRAPRKLIESRFRKEVSDQVKGSLLMDSIYQISQEQDYSPISEPDIQLDAVEVPKEGPMTFEFDVEVRPEFDLPQWKDLTINKPVHEFTKKDVDRQFTRILRRHSQVVPHNGPAETDDYITVDVKFQKDGVVASELKEETICIRPTLSFHDGKLENFDRLMKGAQAGDVKEAVITLSPDAPNEELRGQDVDVTFQVRDVQKVELPELDGELLDQLGGFDSEGELRDAVQGSLEKQLAYQQQQSMRQQITAQLTRSADWKLPPGLLNRQGRRELERAVLELQAAGFGEEEIRAHENELRQNSQASTAAALKEHFILERIAEEEEIEDAPDDYDHEIELIAQQQQSSPRRVRARLEKQGTMDVLRNQIIERKVIELIASHAKFNETKYQPPDSDNIEAIEHTIGGGDETNIPEANHGEEAGELRQPADYT